MTRVKKDYKIHRNHQFVESVSIQSKEMVKEYLK